MISFFESQNHSIFAVQTDQTISKDEIKKLEWLLGNANLLSDVKIKKEFIGGCDIVKEMYENGELTKLFENKGIKFKNKN